MVASAAGEYDGGLVRRHRLVAASRVASVSMSGGGHERRWAGESVSMGGSAVLA